MKNTRTAVGTQTRVQFLPQLYFNSSNYVLCNRHSQKQGIPALRWVTESIIMDERWTWQFTAIHTLKELLDHLRNMLLYLGLLE